MTGLVLGEWVSNWEAQRQVLFPSNFGTVMLPSQGGEGLRVPSDWFPTQ